MITKHFLLLFCFAFSSQVLATGSETGNGGAAVVCRDVQGKITRVDLLDLFEGFALFGRGYKELPLPAAEQARNILPKIEDLFSFAKTTDQSGDLESLIAKLKLLPDGVGLVPTEDWANFIVPKQCSITQAVNFRDDGDIFADGEIWNRYSETQRAAAYIHELIYFYARQNGDEPDSRRVRTLVSLLFSGTPLEPIVPESVTDFCKAGLNEFYIGQSTDKKIQMFFTKLRGRAALDRTLAQSEKSFAGPLFGAGSPGISFDSQIQSKVDRGYSLKVTLAGEMSELMVRFGSENTVDKLKCEKIAD